MDFVTSCSTNLPLILLFGVVLVFAIWWIVTIVNRNSGSAPNANLPDDSDILKNVNEQPPTLWFSDSMTDFHDALGNNPWHYTVVKSDGSVVYSNRPEPPGFNYNTLAEVIMAYRNPQLVSGGKGVLLVRDGRRQWATAFVRNGEVRVVHVEAPLG